MKPILRSIRAGLRTRGALHAIALWMIIMGALPALIAYEGLVRGELGQSGMKLSGDRAHRTGVRGACVAGFFFVVAGLAMFASFGTDQGERA